MNSSIKKWFKNQAAGAKKKNLKSFREDQEKEEAYEYKSIGVRTVPIDRIVGSVGRYHDFDDKFRLKQHLPSDRLMSVKRAMRDGKSLPPVNLYQIRNEYYVQDGNQRVAAAMEFGRSEIMARIVAFIPSEKTLGNVLSREQTEFYEKTGLTFSIELTEIGQYTYLLEQISKHREFLEKQGETVSLEHAAADWYKTVYRPLTSLIEKGRLCEAFSKRTIADLYAYISFFQWEKERPREYGIGIGNIITKSMEEFREKMSKKTGKEYPEMLREITAFILMNVSAKREFRILEKLFLLDEVEEVHSVHGTVDIIAKIVLTRDLLSSDAEVIGHFVHNHVRQISGIQSTQTLIPSLSKIKEKS